MVCLVRAEVGEHSPAFQASLLKNALVQKMLTLKRRLLGSSLGSLVANQPEVRNRSAPRFQTFALFGNLF